MQRVRLERKIGDKKEKSLKSHTKYLLTHDSLGVFIGFAKGNFYWSNLDSGGNGNALLLSKDGLKDPFIKYMIKFMGNHFGNKFSTKTCQVAQDEEYLTMEECVKLGFNKWCEFGNEYYTEKYH